MKKHREREIRMICTRYGFEVLGLRQQRHIVATLAKAGQQFRTVFSSTPGDYCADRNALSAKQLHHCPKEDNPWKTSTDRSKATAS